MMYNYPSLHTNSLKMGVILPDYNLMVNELKLVKQHSIIIISKTYIKLTYIRKSQQIVL
jgi:hypothetical protein